MVKTLERALAEAANLPGAAQERLGEDTLASVDKLRGLRATVEDSLARGGSHSDEDIEKAVAAHLDVWERGRKSS